MMNALDTNGDAQITLADNVNEEDFYTALAYCDTDNSETLSICEI
jgi:hypothetical protein